MRRCRDAGVEEASTSLATTLLVAAVRGSDVEVAAVGDSPAFLLKDKVYDPVVAEPERFDGLVGGGVDALPAIRRHGFGFTVLAGPRIRPAAVHRRSGDAAGRRGRGGGATLARELARPPDVIDFARLLDFSRSTYDDDRSLIAVWGPAP